MGIHSETEMMSGRGRTGILALLQSQKRDAASDIASPVAPEMVPKFEFIDVFEN